MLCTKFKSRITWRLKLGEFYNAADNHLAMATTAIVLVFFGIDTLRNAPETFVAIVCVTALAVILDLVWKRIRGPRQDPDELATAPSPGG